MCKVLFFISLPSVVAMDTDIRIIAESDFGDFRISLREDNIMHIFVRPYVLVEKHMISQGMTFIQELGERKYLNLFEFSEGASVDDEARKWAADENGNRYTIADAMLITSPAQKLVANFYLTYHKPPKPTRFFTKKELAIRWLKKRSL